MKSCNNYFIKSVELSIFWMVFIKAMDSIWGCYSYFKDYINQIWLFSSVL